MERSGGVKGWSVEVEQMTVEFAVLLGFGKWLPEVKTFSGFPQQEMPYKTVKFVRFLLIL